MTAKTLRVLTKMSSLLLSAFLATAGNLPAAAAEVHHFNVAASDAATAIQEFGTQSGVQILAGGEELRGKQLNPVTGKITTDEGLRKLLDGTGLTHRYVGERAIALVPADAPAALHDLPTPSAAGVERINMRLAQAEADQPRDSQDDASAGDRRQQQKSETSKASDAEESQQLVVTGSRLQNSDPASPVFVMDKAEIERRGLNTIEDIVRYLPQNFSTTVSGGTIDFGSPRYSEGAVTINLRGLGEGSTLVLVNGRRIAATAAEQGTFTDVSTLPFSAIERVEVMTDGGSAIYGSDAVGGVVNFILRKDYRGADTKVVYENSSSGGNRYAIEQTAGVSWGSGNITASARYMREDSVRADKAGIDTSGDFRARGGSVFPSSNGQPALISPSGIPGAPAGAYRGILPPGNGTNIDVNDIVWVTTEELQTQSGNFALLPTGLAGAVHSATPETRQLSSYLALSQSLGSRWTLDLSGIYSERRSITERTGGAWSALVPTSNYYNTLGVPVRVYYSFLREVQDGKYTSVQPASEVERFNVFGSLAWDVPGGDWQAVVSYGYGEDRAATPSESTFFTSAFAEAVASSDPDTAINFFGDGTVQRELDSLTAPYDYGARTGEQSVYSVSFSGSLLSLPAGEVGLAFGGEMRTDKVDFTQFSLNPIIYSTPGGARRNVIPASDNSAFYAELQIPIVGSNNVLPGVRRLSLQLAGRYDDYRIEGPFEGTANPDSRRSFSDSMTKIGAAWYPLDSLKIRASWGQAFQAPTLPELFAPVRFVTTSSILDPLNPISNGGPFTPVYAVFGFGGNPNLKAQQSQTTAIGFELAPLAVPGLFLSATLNRTRFTGIISDLPANFGFPGTFALENWQLFPDIIQRDADGVLTRYDVGVKFNLAGRASESLDVDARYSFETDKGAVTTGIAGTHTLRLDSLIAGVDPIQLDGTDRGPTRWKGSAYADWSYRNWAANITLNYESGYRNSKVQVNPNIVRLTDLRTAVSSYTTVDVRASYELPQSGWRLSAGVQNLFDADFPFFDDFFGVDSSHVDFRRRVMFVNVGKDFSW